MNNEEKVKVVKKDASGDEKLTIKFAWGAWMTPLHHVHTLIELLTVQSHLSFFELFIGPQHYYFPSK